MKRRNISIAISLFLVFSLAQSQETAKKKCCSKPAIGLLFTLQGLNDLELDTYNGGIGVKIFIGNMAIRPAVAFMTAKSEEEPGNVGVEGVAISKTDVGADFDLLRHCNVGSKLTPYVGLGVGYSKGKEKIEPEHPTGQNPVVTEENSSTFDAHGIIGVEYYIGKKISLAGEYVFGYYHIKTATKRTGEFVTNPESTIKISGFSISTTARLILAVYL